MKSMDEVNIYTPHTNTKWYEKLIKFNGGKAPTKYIPVRFIGNLFETRSHWVDQGKNRFPIPCFKYDYKTDKVDPNAECPGCLRGFALSVRYWINLIDRTTQTLCALEMSPALLTQLTQLKPLNGGVSITDPLLGRDVAIFFDNSGQFGKWMVQRMDSTPLTETEKALPLFDFEALFIQEKLDSVKKSLERKND
jgi:hypothetical protein